MINKTLTYLFTLSRLNKRAIQTSTDALLVWFSFTIAMALSLNNFNFYNSLDQWIILAFAIPTTIIIFSKLGLYRSLVRYISTKTLIQIAKGGFLSTLSILLISELFSLSVPRTVLIIYLIILIITTGGLRFTIRDLYRAQKDLNFKYIAIYGAGHTGMQLLNSLNINSHYKPVIFIDDNEKLHGLEISGIPVFSFNDAVKHFSKLEIKVILISIPSAPTSVLKNISKQLEKYSIEVKSVPSMLDLIDGRIKIEELKNISIEELLGREAVPPKIELMKKNISEKTVLITGAGGTIGSELALQILKYNPKKVILFDNSEYSLYKTLNQISVKENSQTDIVPKLGSVQNISDIENIFKNDKINTIYHAAAFKHVPLVEINIIEGIKNNVFGTLNLAKSAIYFEVDDFILISTDKAVRPSSVMGATKRLAELICQGLARQANTTFSMVRFGNVMGSSGSVIPQFEAQIASGGPLTVTHKEINRYFMTIPEAAELVIQAGSMAKGGDVFVLDMGSPIKILELAEKMVRIHGLKPFLEEEKNTNPGDIEIKITGLRDGEKLFEELLIGENSKDTEHPRIMTAKEVYLDYKKLIILLDKLLLAVEENNLISIKEILLTKEIGMIPQN